MNCCSGLRYDVHFPRAFQTSFDLSFSVCGKITKKVHELMFISEMPFSFDQAGLKINNSPFIRTADLKIFINYQMQSARARGNVWQIPFF